MTTRLYFLVPNEESAEQVTTALHTQGITDDNIYAVASRESYPLKTNIPDASLIERSDVVNAAKRGAVVGGTAGLFAGLTAALLTPLGLIAAGGAVAGLATAGAVTGTWLSTMIGVSIPNSDLNAFQAAIDNGQILMLADVDNAATEVIKNTVLLIYPRAVIGSGQL